MWVATDILEDHAAFKILVLTHTVLRYIKTQKTIVILNTQFYRNPSFYKLFSALRTSLYVNCIYVALNVLGWDASTLKQIIMAYSTDEAVMIPIKSMHIFINVKIRLSNFVTCDTKRINSCVQNGS